MTCTSQQIDLVMHLLKRDLFERLKLSSLVREGEFYYITDDKPTEDVISSALSTCYKIKSNEFNNDVSAIVSADATYVYQNETKLDLNIYKISRAQYESLKQQQLLRDDAYYYILDDPSVDDKISGFLSSYYSKNETSSSVLLASEFARYQVSGDYATKEYVNLKIGTIDIILLEIVG